MEKFLLSFTLSSTVINSLAVIAGALIGWFLRKRLPERVMTLPMQGVSLFVLVLGISMALKTDKTLIVIVSIALGSIIGELINLELWLEKLAKKIEQSCKGLGDNFSAGFITATLIFCTGSMAVLGSFEAGLGQYPALLLAKSLMDGLISITLAASLGIGVAFSSVPIFLYQGTLTLLAVSLSPFMTPEAVSVMTATGGLMLMAIGTNNLGLTRIRVMNMVPGLVVAVIFSYIL